MKQLWVVLIVMTVAGPLRGESNPLAPGEGTVCFVGIDGQWNAFSKPFYADD